MSDFRFDPPGFVKELSEESLFTWHKYISQSFDEARDKDTIELPDGRKIKCSFYGPRHHFINPSKTPFAADAKEIDIEWTAFPRNVSIQFISDRQRWKMADSSRDMQDEYCEWSIVRTSEGRIRKIMFTCETPEYWRLLSIENKDALIKLYQGHVNGDVLEEHLFHANGEYNPRNIWNNSTENGVMHLIQVNNTLGAEIELAGGASMRRIIDGRELTGELELIDCGKYGGRERHSDPHIGAGTNSVARQSAFVSLANPVGIYFSNLNTQGWTTPDGTDAGSFWQYTRGTQDKPVRAVFEVPEKYGYLVSDIQIGGKNIEFGGQIADHILMKLTAVGSNFGNVSIPPVNGCVQDCIDNAPRFELSLVETFNSQLKSMGSLRNRR